MTLCRRRPVSSLMSTSLVWQRGRATELFQTGIGLGWYWYPPSISNDGGQTHRDIREEQTNKQKIQEHHWTDVIKSTLFPHVISSHGCKEAWGPQVTIWRCWSKRYGTVLTLSCVPTRNTRDRLITTRKEKKTFIKDLKLFWCCYKETRIYSTRGQHRLHTTARCRTDIRAVDQNLETDIL